MTPIWREWLLKRVRSEIASPCSGLDTKAWERIEIEGTASWSPAPNVEILRQSSSDRLRMTLFSEGKALLGLVVYTERRFADEVHVVDHLRRDADMFFLFLIWNPSVSILR